mgnify:CR=1 FL=1
MNPMFNEYKDAGKIQEALLIGRNMVNKAPGDSECVNAYLDFLLMLAEKLPRTDERKSFADQANLVLSFYEENGKTDLTKCTEIDLQKLDAELRMQRIVFEAAAQVYEQMNASWQNQGTKFALLGQVIQLTQKYIESGAIQIDPPLYGTDPVRRRIIYMMNMNRIVQHLWDFIRLEMTSKTVPVFDANRRVRSTADMPTWYTSKPCNITQHSQISHCVYDSGWEATEAYLLEKNEHVKAWAKNDHLGFEIVYVYEGVVRKYIPDYLVKLDNGKTLVLETKGRMTEKDIAKRKALSTWIEAVNGTGEFGMWCNDVSLNVADVDAIIAKQL